MECFGKVVLLLFLDGFTICRSVLIATMLGISPFIQFQWWMFHVKIINIWSHHSTACVYDTQIIEYNCMLVFLSSFYLVAYLSINHILWLFFYIDYHRIVNLFRLHATQYWLTQCTHSLVLESCIEELSVLTRWGQN